MLAQHDGKNAEIPVIDVDTHLTEPHDLWTSRAPAAWRDRVPQVKMIDGRRNWVIDGGTVLGPAMASSVVRRNGDKAIGLDFMGFEIDDVHKGCWDVKTRLEVMDQAGITAQIVYPNLLGFGGQRASQFPADIRLMSVQIYNDAMAELQETSGQRLFPMALLPWWDLAECLQEIERCKAMGLRGLNTNSDPHLTGLPDLACDYWDPLWEMCSDLSMPINFHIGASDESMSWYGSTPWPSQSDDIKLALGSATMYMTNTRFISNIIFSGVLERFPKLKFVSVESGLGWIPFILDALDYQLNETAPSALSFMTMKPSEYFRRQIYACFWFERDGLLETIRRVGEDNVMFETDFPHPTCLYPDPIGYIQEAIDALPLDVARKAMGGNAAKLYNIPLEPRA